MVKHEESKKVSGLMFDCTLGAVFGMVVTLLMLYVFSILVSSGKLPPEFGESLIVAACFVGVTAGSFAAVKRRGRGVLPCALLCGGVWFLLVLVFSVFGGGAIFDVIKLKLLICAVAGSAFGSALHVNRAGQKIKRRNK